MELHYDITKQDFIDFNLNYYNNNAIVQRSIRCTMKLPLRLSIVILGGSALMYWLHTAHAGFHRVCCARCRLLLGYTALYAS